METTLNGSSAKADFNKKKGHVLTTFDSLKEDASSKAKDFAESIHLDEHIEEVKGFAQSAIAFVKRRPILVLSVACAAGGIAAWAIASRKKAV